ncbi:MAG: PP2C family protein-serine/threonine phosphatase [Methylobacter sp.]
MFTPLARFKKLIARKKPTGPQFRVFSPYVASHIGDREENQDAYDYDVLKNTGFFIVADGMGGHSGGRLASRYFTEALKNLYLGQTKPIRQPEQALKEMIGNARMEMCRRVAAEAPDLSPHTTCVCALLQENQLWVVHVGDSRLYLIENDSIVWQTKDHSIAQLMVDEGELDPEDVTNDDSQNMLYRSISCNKVYETSVKHFQNIQPDSSLLLCSDGLWQYISAEEIIRLNEAKDPQIALQQSVDNAYQRANGKADNITALLIKIS